MTAERQGEIAKSLYRQEFVGKGFQAFGVGVKKEIDKLGDPVGKQIQPGAIAGGLREFFGNISPEEATFRGAVLDFADVILRARSGAQINEQEFARMKRFLFRLFDEPAAFVPRMDRVLLQVSTDINNAIKISTTPAEQLMRERADKGERKRFTIGE